MRLSGEVETRFVGKKIIMKALLSAFLIGVSSQTVPEPQYYLGCFIDHDDRDLPNLLISNGATSESCRAAALGQQYEFYGLQFGSL
jgi:hypothetical protein